MGYESKENIARREIVCELLEKGYVTKKELAKKLNRKEDTIKKDIIELRKEGVPISKGNAEVFHLESEYSVDEIYELSDKKLIRKVFIFLVLYRKGGCTSEQVWKELKEFNRDAMADKDDKKDDETGAVSKRTVRGDLRELKEQNIVELRDKKYYLSDRVPFQLEFEEEEADELIQKLEMNCEGHHYEVVLKNILRKLKLAYYGEDIQNEIVELFSFHKKYQETNQLDYFLSKLNELPYEKKELEIVYKNQYGKEISKCMMVGNVVFSVEKDRLYLFGDVNGKPSIIHFDSIVDIKETERENTVFQNKFYKEIIEDMLSVSIEESVYVKVEFDNIYQIKAKLQRLKENRKNAVLTEIEECLIYEDKISGLDDFAKYLRRYGSSCRVIEPKELREKMLYTASHILEAYQKLEEV